MYILDRFYNDSKFLAHSFPWGRAQSEFGLLPWLFRWVRLSISSRISSALSSARPPVHNEWMTLSTHRAAKSSRELYVYPGTGRSFSEWLAMWHQIQEGDATRTGKAASSSCRCSQTLCHLYYRGSGEDPVPWTLPRNHGNSNEGCSNTSIVLKVDNLAFSARRWQPEWPEIS